ncbi:MAG: TlpA family protein disulfide reductase [Endomicrobium sp.]|jgi:peroxiredoxin|nr:TlpA family protein disulfide reductase [Endomicrobium sp.]
MQYKKIFLFFAFLMFTVVYAYAQQAPDFTLQDTNGKAVTLSDYKGKVVFIDFWASWCPPCISSVPAVKYLHKKMSANQDVVVLGINSGEDAKTVASFMNNMGIDYPNLYSNNSVIQKYKITGIPAFFIINKNGEIVKKYSGYRKNLEKEWYEEIEKLLK